MSEAALEQPLSGEEARLSLARPVRPLVPARMRLFDKWWERMATLAPFAPLIATLLTVVVLRPMGYYWE